MAEPGCEWLHEVGPELSLGLLSAEDHSAALAHLSRCPECRVRLTEYNQVGDGLLALLPGVEPPVGFEDRVMARMGLGGSPASAPAPASSTPLMPIAAVEPIAAVVRLRPRRRWVPIAAAAAVAALVFGLGGWALGSHGVAARSVASANLVHGTLLTAAHHSVGDVWEFTGKQPWVYMHVTDQPTSKVSCQLERRDGSFVDIGSFQLADGAGAWGAPAYVDPGTVTGARLVGPDGTVLADAALP